MKNKKIIIIGSGLGGLISGNLLCKKGYEVTIFESAEMPGGYTAGFWKNGFYFESGTCSFETSKSLFATLKEIGVFQELEFKRLKFRLIKNGLDIFLDDYKKFKSELLNKYPNEKPQLKRCFNEIDKLYELSKLFIVHEKKDIINAITKPWKLIKQLYTFKKYLNTTSDEFVTRFLKKGTIPYEIIRNMGYPNMAASFIGGSFCTIIDDYWTVKGGIQKLTDALVNNFKKSGGKIKLNHNVSKILTKDKRAIGVISNEKEYHADYIISACDYKKTFLHLLDNQKPINKKVLNKIKSAPVSEGIFTTYLGLNLPNEKLLKYIKSTDIVGNVHIFSPSLIDPKTAPENKSCIMIQKLAPYEWTNQIDYNNKEVYLKEKNKIQKELIEQASKVIENLENYIEFKQTATPFTYERYTQNHKGATSAWSWNPKKKFYSSLLSITVKTPIKNLYVGSCWASQFGGIPGALSAAKKCVKKIG